MAIRAANQKHHREFGTHAGRQYWECTKHVVNVYVVNSVASIPCVQRVFIHNRPNVWFPDFRNIYVMDFREVLHLFCRDGWFAEGRFRSGPLWVDTGKSLFLNPTYFSYKNLNTNTICNRIMIRTYMYWDIYGWCQNRRKNSGVSMYLYICVKLVLYLCICIFM